MAPARVVRRRSTLRPSGEARLRAAEDSVDLGASVKQVEALTAPRNMVVVGASDRPGSWPATVWKTVHEHGFAGPIFAVNPNRATISGERCYPDFASLPQAPDHLIVLVPAPMVPDAVRRGAQAGARSAT